MHKFKKAISVIAIFLVGLVLGGYLFHRSQPRSFLAVNHCQDGSCLQGKDLLGLAASVGLTHFPDALPERVMETDKTVVIKHPFPQAPIHYVVIPKKDIRNAGSILPGDEAYLVDAYAVMDKIIRDQHLTNYKIITNGPDFQQVTYLHFHLVSY